MASVVELGFTLVTAVTQALLLVLSVLIAQSYNADAVFDWLTVVQTFIFFVQTVVLFVLQVVEKWRGTQQRGLECTAPLLAINALLPSVEVQQRTGDALIPQGILSSSTAHDPSLPSSNVNPLAEL